MLKPVLADSYRRWSEDQVPRLSAALTFYLMLALSPMLLLLVATIGMVMGEQSFRETFLGQVKGSMGEAQATFLASIIETRNQAGTGILASIFAFGVMLFGASGLFEQLRDSVNAIWGVVPKNCGFISMVIRKVAAVLMVMLGAVVLGGWMILDARLHYLQTFKPAGVLEALPIWQIVSVVTSIGFWSLMFAIAFKYLPQTKVAWRDVWLAAFLTSLGFTLGKYALSMYFSYSSVSEAYGSAGAIVLILLWTYYSAQIFFFGVEMSDSFAHTYGSLRDEPKKTENAVGAVGVPARPASQEPSPPGYLS